LSQPNQFRLEHVLRLICLFLFLFILLHLCSCGLRIIHTQRTHLKKDSTGTTKQSRVSITTYAFWILNNWTEVEGKSEKWESGKCTCHDAFHTSHIPHSIWMLFFMRLWKHLMGLIWS